MFSLAISQLLQNVQGEKSKSWSRFLIPGTKSLIFLRLLKQIEQEIDESAADGAYDKRKVYDGLNAHSQNVKILIPPRKNARIWKHGNTKAERLKRDENLRSIRKHGRKAWKENSGYHVRSLSETAMFRLKTIFGDQLSARLLETQTTQAVVGCAALNKMTHLGMPQSYKIA